MSGAGFTAVDYELFVQTSAAATNFTVRTSTDETNQHSHYSGKWFEVLWGYSAHKASRHEDACIAGANGRKILKYIFFFNKGGASGD